MKQTIKLTKEELEDIWNRALLKGYANGYIDAENNFPFDHDTSELPKSIVKLFEDKDD